MDRQVVKIPKSIWVKGQEYLVIATQSLIDNEHCDGTTDYINKTIKYDSALKGDMLKRCLIHELGHAVQFETGLRQALNDDILEIITENFSNVINDLIHWRFK